MRFLAPPPLRPGDRVAVVAPAGPFDRPSFEKGLEVLKTRYQPVFTERLFDTHRYLAGTDAVRGADLQAALDHTEVKAVFAARGGYGAMRLLPSVSLSSPKWLVGFSDLTALHCAAQVKGWQSLHAPVLTQLGKQPPEVVEHFFAQLEGAPATPLLGSMPLVSGLAEGPLLGGNLSVLTRLIGTPWFPSLDGAVLLIEDVGERPYRLDRMWQHLVLSGALKGVRGVVLGDFTGCDEKDASYSWADVLGELVRELGVPAAAGFRIGHGDQNWSVALGRTVQLETRSTLPVLTPLA
jgi:muramoyltetrapeptide carboxypeptidase